MGKSIKQGKYVIFNKTAIFSFGWNYPNSRVSKVGVSEIRSGGSRSHISKQGV